MTLPSRQLQAALTVCFPACLLELCLMPKNSAFYPLYAGRRTFYASNCGSMQRSSRSACPTSLTASAQPQGIKSP